jgi:hypothetical protein
VPLRRDGSIAKSRPSSFAWLKQDGRGRMRAEIENLVSAIKQSVGLLRRHL